MAIACPRCNGSVVRDHSLDGPVWACVACGHETPARAAPNAHPDREARIAEVARLTAAGYSITQIARETGIPEGSIHGLRRLGQTEVSAAPATTRPPAATVPRREETRMTLPPRTSDWIEQAREECARLVRDVEAVNGKRRRAEQIVAALKAMGAEAPALPWRGKAAAKGGEA